MNIDNIKLFIIILIIFYIVLTILIYKFFCKKCKDIESMKSFDSLLDQENFIGISPLLLTLSGNNNYSNISENNIQTNIVNNETIKENNKNNKNNTVNLNGSNDNNYKNQKKKKYIYLIENERNNQLFKYRFYDKNMNNYMNFYGRLGFIKEVKIFDLENNIIGNLLNEKYNKFILKSELYENRNINIEFYNNFKEAKIYLDDSDKIFFIKIVNNTYLLYLYSKFIGKIYFEKSGKNNKYKIGVYEEYKNYLNLFAIGFLLMINIT